MGSEGSKRKRTLPSLVSDYWINSHLPSQENHIRAPLLTLTIMWHIINNDFNINIQYN